VCDAVSALADHDHQLGLVVNCLGWQLHNRRGTGYRRRELGKYDRVGLGQGKAGLGRVRAVVQADGEHLARLWNRCAQFVRAVAGGLGSPDRLGVRGVPGAELGPLLVDGLRVGRELAPRSPLLRRWHHARRPARGGF